MKKIVKNKLYDTETANPLIRWECGLPGDFGHYTETLYIKKTGEYFMCGIGAAMSPYGDCDFAIIPLTEEGAKKWAVNRCEADTYMEIFGKVEE